MQEAELEQKWRKHRLVTLLLECTGGLTHQLYVVGQAARGGGAHPEIVQPQRGVRRGQQRPRALLVLVVVAVGAVRAKAAGVRVIRIGVYAGVLLNIRTYELCTESECAHQHIAWVVTNVLVHAMSPSAAEGQRTW